jgi:FkbM family methyltransferase
MANMYKNLKREISSKLYYRVKPPNLRGYYGQFAEDAALQTYFINRRWDETKEYEVKGEGFYVDIGAFSPVLISNSYWFYQHGWGGINVEPFPDVLKQFNELRPRDINVSGAIGGKNGLQKYYSWGNSNLNTFSLEKVKEYISDGKATREPAVIDIEMVRMETLFERYLPFDQPIDFISVDVEGMDLEVLSSNNWEKYRPELVVVELDRFNIDEVIQSELYRFMLEVDYKLFYWLSPSIIFADVHK